MKVMRFSALVGVMMLGMSGSVFSAPLLIDGGLSQLDWSRSGGIHTINTNIGWTYRFKSDDPNAQGGGFEVNTAAGSFEVMSGRSPASYFDFKGNQNLTADYVGRLHHEDGKGFSFHGAAGFPFRVAVDGLLTAKEIRVATNVWADYVFSPDYELMSLADLESYIGKNSRLPGIPSAEEIVENGQDLGALQVKMMEKIEELTLHVISLNRKVESQAAEIESLRTH